MQWAWIRATHKGEYCIQISSKYCTQSCPRMFVPLNVCIVELRKKSNIKYSCICMFYLHIVYMHITINNKSSCLFCSSSRCLCSDLRALPSFLSSKPDPVASRVLPPFLSSKPEPVAAPAMNTETLKIQNDTRWSILVRTEVHRPI